MKSLKLAREIDHKEWEAWCLDPVASTYKDPSQAIQMYQEALDLFEKLEAIEGQSRILNNWAYTLMESKEYASALEMAQKSLELAKLGDLKGDVINIAATIGEIYTGMGEYAQAQSGLREATLLFDTHGRDISSVYILVDLGQVYLEQNELDQAEQVLNNALEASQEMEMRNEQARCDLYLADVFERRGRFDKALEYYKKFQALREGISGESALNSWPPLRGPLRASRAKPTARSTRTLAARCPCSG